MDPRGAYTADRTAALSGVPKSTVHYWARRGILVPSISDVRIKLWSYSDLMSLRTIAWLRATKTAPDGHDVPATAMSAVRRALQELLELDLGLWTEDVGPGVAVDRRGKIVLDPQALPQHADGQRRFALDQNFPEPIVDGLVDWLASDAELMPIRRIDERMATLDDWEVLQALHTDARAWDGLITTDAKMPSLPRELAVLCQTRLTLVAAQAVDTRSDQGHRPRARPHHADLRADPHRHRAGLAPAHEHEAR